ncbi:Por secretion system C-terminal sorting domain-containing protein [Pricia antarctica]|uniref:Por secretion system C-terminal sorting domain-containing protein n=1 Tax=Pricia antarctica TaxID=641691 RepID=A0A1G7ACT8_9FLAO|nr:T9SS type A sorting domain-containing protein [Pricia antarctica]SDE12287.1 Por secretion system C-terminal sorting domain-containing protein [Pricia antarctica]
MKQNYTPKTIGIIIFTIFINTWVNGQRLHHQMISAQGKLAELESGHYVSQSIGQQSSTGSSQGKSHIVLQGFQQSAWARLIKETVLPKRQSITVFPNPFVGTVNFQFSEAIQGDMQILLFDIEGRLVADRSLTISNNALQVQFNFLSPGLYLVHLQHEALTYYTKIIKKVE